MIEVNSLMLGNWVYDGDKTQFPMYVQAIGEDYVYLDFEGREGDVWESTPEDLQGIPITEELLTRMGARRVTDIGWNVIKTCLAGVRIECRVILFSGSEIDVKISRDTPHFEDRCQSSSIHYLHELQNLYRYITKQELEVKL